MTPLLRNGDEIGHDEYSIRLNAEIKRILINDYPSYYERFYHTIVPFTNKGQDFTIIDETLNLSDEEKIEFKQFKTILAAIKNAFV